MLIAEAAELAIEALAAGLDMCGAGHGEAVAALCAADEPVIFVIGNCAIEVGLFIGEWGEEQAVFVARAAGEGEGGEKIFMSHNAWLF